MITSESGLGFIGDILSLAPKPAGDCDAVSHRRFNLAALAAGVKFRSVIVSMQTGCRSHLLTGLQPALATTLSRVSKAVQAASNIAST